MIRWNILRPASEDAQNSPPRIIHGDDLTIEIGPLPPNAPLTLNSITMDTGDKISLENITEPLIGAYLAYGELIDDNGDIRVFDRTWTTEWADNPKTGIFTAGSQGAEWVCLQKRDQDISVSLLTVSGSAVVPANTGFVVVKGSVTFDGKECSAVRYFKPRPIQMPITGSADILMVAT